MVSVVIPVFNDEKRLERCLRSVFASDCRDYEVIVVNDGSTDGSLKIIQSFPCRLVNLEKNSGVAKARNMGASAAKGDLLIYFDSDIVIEKDTITNFKRLHEDPDIKISSCQVYPRSLSGGFATDLLALDWHYIYKEIEGNASYIPSMNFAIYKDVFDDIGRFNDAFGMAGGEEIEIGMHAVQKGYRIHVEQSFSVHHHFQGFWPRCRTLFRRGYLYGRIVLQRNFALDKGHGTSREAVNAMLSLLGVGSLPLSLLFPFLWVLFPATVITQLILDMGLNSFIIREKGALFFVRSIPIHYIWYFVMGLSIIKAVSAHFYEKVILRKEGPYFVRNLS